MNSIKIFILCLNFSDKKNQDSESGPSNDYKSGQEEKFCLSTILQLHVGRYVKW